LECFLIELLWIHALVLCFLPLLLFFVGLRRLILSYPVILREIVSAHCQGGLVTERGVELRGGMGMRVLRERLELVENPLVVEDGEGVELV
jgi:hypothetical protein